MMQPNLIDTLPAFDGPDLQPEDHARLGKQMARVKAVMADGQWRTLAQLAALCYAPEASVSAQLRHLRKLRYGAHTIGRRHLGRGLYVYKLELSPATHALETAL